jgi:hypothetical protein
MSTKSQKLKIEADFFNDIDKIRTNLIIANFRDKKFNVKEFIEELHEHAETAYKKTQECASNGSYQSHLYPQDTRKFHLKTYSGDEYPHSEIDKDLTHTNSKCVALKAYVEAMNKYGKYDLKMKYTNYRYSGPRTFEEDIHDKINSHVGCSAFFTWA